jgi:hypothetical protein
MKPKIIILTLLVLMALAMIPVQAMYITMANPQGITERDILVYNSTGQLQGIYNSTSTIALNGSEDYIFSMKPMQTNLLEDPASWLDNAAIPFLQTYYLYIAMMIFLAMIWLGEEITCTTDT